MININFDLSIDQIQEQESEEELAILIQNEIKKKLIEAFDQYINNDTKIGSNFDNEKNIITFISNVIVFYEEEFFNKIEQISQEMQKEGFTAERAAEICEILAFDKEEKNESE